ncbi:MAG: histidinol dehydrogenase [Treponema sp.]|nr:histidinol dehydrogenase [Treponema sp.]
MQIIQSKDFETYWKSFIKKADDIKPEKVVRKIINDVRVKGDVAIKKYAKKFDRSSPDKLEVPFSEAKRSLEKLRVQDSSLVEAMELAARNIKRFSEKQREQFINFEYEIDSGVIAGQRVIPVQKAAVYIPSGRFPLFSSLFMCMIPAFCAGVEEVMLSSPPGNDGLPDQKILAAAAVAVQTIGVNEQKLRIFAVGGAQAIAAFTFGTESIPRVDVIAGPGSKFIATAKKLLYGDVGIDFIAGPTDILIIADGKSDNIDTQAEIVAADMLGQAEHDADARARVLVPSEEFADKIALAVEKQITALPGSKTARASLDAGGLITVYQNKEDAVRIANIIAPEHLELQVMDADTWIGQLKNYGSLFIGSLSAEVLGDYSAGINHTLPTSQSARFTGGLSVRHFIKTVTTLKCSKTESFEKIRNAAEILARAEGLEAHALSAAKRKS